MIRTVDSFVVLYGYAVAQQPRVDPQFHGEDHDDSPNDEWPTGIQCDDPASGQHMS